MYLICFDIKFIQEVEKRLLTNIEQGGIILKNECIYAKSDLQGNTVFILQVVF